MKISLGCCLLGEGPDDIGREGLQGGALAGFLHAALNGPNEPVDSNELPFEIAALRKWRELQLLPKKKSPKSFKKLVQLEPDAERVRAALLLTTQSGLDGAAILRDCEVADNMSLGETLRQVRDDFGQREPDGARPACVIGAPSRCHETWLLADRTAVQTVFGKDGVYHFSKDPEDRPDCNKLKKHLDKHAAQIHQAEYEVRRMLAFAAQPDELWRMCKVCYPAFWKDVDAELRNRFGLPGLPPKLQKTLNRLCKRT